MHKATALLTAARLLGPVVSIFLLAVLARWRGPGEVGLYGIGIATFALLEAAVSLGFRNLLPRELSRRKEPSLLATAALLNLFSGVILSIILAAVSFVCLSEPERSILLLVAAILPISGLMVSWEGKCLAEEKVSRLIWALFIEQMVRGAMGFALLVSGQGAPAMLICLLVGRILAMIIAWPRDVFKGRYQSGTMRHLMAQIPVFLGIEACFQLYWRVDVLLLAALGARQEVGFYVAAYRVFSSMLLLPQSYGQILLPRLSKEWKTRTLSRGYRDLAAIGGIFTVLILLLNKSGIHLLYGGGYEPAAGILFILGLGFIPACVDQAQGKALVARGAQIWDLAALAFATLVNIALNLLLIPRFGGEGAAWATLGSLTISLGFHRWALLRIKES